MRALGYFRSEDGGASLETLGEAFREYCDLNLHQPVKSFGDVADGDSTERPAYDRMSAYIRESGSEFLIVVPDARHLGLDLESVARAVVELEAAGSKVTCDDDDFPDPLQNAFQILGVKGVSRTRSDRIKEAMRERALKGKGLGRPPYGSRNGERGGLEIVKDEAPVVELIFRLYTGEKIGLRLIAQDLNGRGIKTRRGGQWNVVTIRDILKNLVYTGTYTRFGFRVPRSHEAIIDAKVFRAAQDETESRRPVGRVVNAEPFVLSGLAYCASCGNKMMGVTRRQTWKRKDGRRSQAVYRYYQCQSRNNLSVCDYHTWRAAKLEGAVLSQLPPLLAAGAAAPALDSSGLREERRTRVQNAERRCIKAMRRTASGQGSIQKLGWHLTQLDSARETAQGAGPPVDVDTVLAGWESLAVADRQRFLKERIERIVVKDDSVEVVVRR